MTSSQVLQHCEGRLAKYKWPKYITFKKDFRRTSLGKVRKDVLRLENPR
jgi:long-chain acyl-CoA synthetase